MPPDARQLDATLAADPDRRLTDPQVREFLGISRDRLRLLEKLRIQPNRLNSHSTVPGSAEKTSALRMKPSLRPPLPQSFW